MTAGRYRIVTLVLDVTVAVVWCVGWILAFQSAQRNLYFEPTDEAVRAASDSVPWGVFGCGVTALVAIIQVLRYRRIKWLLMALPGVLVGVLLLREPESHGQPFAAWIVLTILLVPIGVALLISRLSRRRVNRPSRSR